MQTLLQLRTNPEGKKTNVLGFISLSSEYSDSRFAIYCFTHICVRLCPSLRYRRALVTTLAVHRRVTATLLFTGTSVLQVVNDSRKLTNK